MHDHRVYHVQRCFEHRARLLALSRAPRTASRSACTPLLACHRPLRSAHLTTRTIPCILSTEAMRRALHGQACDEQERSRGTRRDPALAANRCPSRAGTRPTGSSMTRERRSNEASMSPSRNNPDPEDGLLVHNVGPFVHNVGPRPLLFASNVGLIERCLWVRGIMLVGRYT